MEKCRLKEGIRIEEAEALMVAVANLLEDRDEFYTFIAPARKYECPALLVESVLAFLDIV